MWSAIVKTHVQASQGPTVIARVQAGSTKTLSVIVNNLGPGALFVGTALVVAQQGLVSTITSGDLSLHSSNAIATDIELQYSEAS